MDLYSRGALFGIAEKIVRLLTQLLSLVLMARLMDPAEFGSLMYAFAVVSMFNAISIFGLDAQLIKWLSIYSVRSPYIVKSAFLLRCFFSVACFFVVNFLPFLGVGDPSLVFIISIYLLVMPWLTYEWIFTSIGRSDYSSIGLLIGYIVGFLYRLGVLLLGATPYLLAWAYVLELVVVSFVYSVIGRQLAIGLFDGGFNASRKLLALIFRRSFPLAISSLLVFLYVKIDQVMVGYMLGDLAAANYVSATRLSDALYVFGILLVNVYFPKYVSSIIFLNGDVRSPYEMNRKIFWLVLLSVLGCVFVVYFSDFIVSCLYGGNYAQASPVLAYTIWTVPLVYLGAITTRVYVALGKNWVMFKRSAAALAINVILNLLLIPVAGLEGAAFASVVAHLVAALLMNAVLDFSVFKWQIRVLMCKAKNW
ncbi:flippase [Thalassolituus sp. LLYu03]|uniref:flippase n=1 Tax=Thalassolituus sp. LLYu03 TaxID=3421656 RepID=UPI003D2834FC